MTDYITRKAAIENVIWAQENQMDKVGALECTIAADVTPVVHGQWISAFDEILCSVCKRSWNYTYNDTDTFNYCPNCGAQMDGGDA